jgi:hypothetical protein
MPIPDMHTPQFQYAHELGGKQQGAIAQELPE